MDSRRSCIYCTSKVSETYVEMLWKVKHEDFYVFLKTTIFSSLVKIWKRGKINLNLIKLLLF